MTIIANNSGITSPSATSVTNALKGKFIRLAGIPDGYQNSELKYAVGSVFYCPESISCFVKDAFNDGNHYICLDGIKNVPTKTENVVTYPVSTNPNAYQEGDDAKEAGYTLGDVVNGTYFLGNANVGYVMSYKTATSLSVSDNGVLSMPTDATSFNVTYSKNGLTTDQIKSYFAGKFVQLVAVGSDSVFSPSSLFKTAPSEILFIPSNSVVTKDEFKNFNIDRYQPVTGYAAIPAGTTIEYLGKLGDKARVQVLSYVGTGTYGSSNPNSLTFDFVPKCVFLQCIDYGPYRTFFIRGAVYANFKLSEGTSSQNHILWNSKTVSWFSTSYVEYQYNESGKKYIAIAIG